MSGGGDASSECEDGRRGGTADGPTNWLDTQKVGCEAVGEQCTCSEEGNDLP